MLYLERKAGDSFRIGETKVTLIAVNGKRVVLGVEADSGMRIMRAEIVASEAPAHPCHCLEPHAGKN